MTMPRRTIGVVLLVSGFASAGCSGPGQPTDPASTDQRVSRPILDLIDEDVDSDPLVQKARYATIERCMHEAGHARYTAPPVSEEAGTQAYGSLPVLGSGSVEPDYAPAPPPDTPLSQAELKTLGGSGKTATVTGRHGETVSLQVDGCGTSGDLAVLGGVKGWKQRTTELMNIREALDAAGQQMAADPRVTAKLGEWSVCMKEAGHDFTTPDQLSAQQPKGIEWSQWSVAKDDIACKNKTGLMTTGLAVMGEKEKAALDANPALITTWRERQRLVLANSKRILGQ